MRDAYDTIHIRQRRLKELIRQNTRRILKPKQTMIRKHRPNPKMMRMQNTLMAQARKARMGVHEPDALAEHDRAEVREECEEVWERGGAGDGREGDVVDFEAWGEIADAGAVWRVGVGEDDDFVPSAEELGAEDVDVVLDAADVGEEEVGYHPVE